jgi:hypothetical protein
MAVRFVIVTKPLELDDPLDDPLDELEEAAAVVEAPPPLPICSPVTPLTAETVP